MTDKTTPSLAEVIALSPCPFCGGGASRLPDKHHRDSGDSRTFVSVGCHDFGCSVMPKAGFYGPWGYRQPEDPDSNESALEAAITAWNTRTSAASLRDEGVSEERRRWFVRAGDYLVRAQKAEALLKRCRDELQESDESEGRHSGMRALIAAIDAATQPAAQERQA